MQLNVIFEDNHIIVVEKIIGVPTQQDASNEIDMYNLIKDYIKEKYQKPGNVFLGIVHRLDRPVGGIMVFAKTSKAASRLSEQIRNRTFKKEYLALTEGEINNKNGILENYLLKNEKTNTVTIEKNDKNGAKLAKLDYEVVKVKDNKTLVRVNLHTGRPHQIRVQFAGIGHPLVGDMKYGKNSAKVDIALWAHKVTFKHPTKDEVLEFSLEPRNESIQKFLINR